MVVKNGLRQRLKPGRFRARIVVYGKQTMLEWGAYARSKKYLKKAWLCPPCLIRLFLNGWYSTMIF